MVNLPEIVPADWPETCTQKEFATLIGLSAPAVCKHGKAKRLVMDGKRVNVRASIEAIRRNTHPGRGGDRTGKARNSAASALPASGPAHAPAAAARGASSAPASEILIYQDEAAREKRASAQLREMEVAEKAGQLCETAKRDAAEFTRARMAREAILSIPDRLAVQLAPALPPEEVHAVLLAECRRICNLLAAAPGSALESSSE